MLVAVGVVLLCFFFFSSRRRHTRCREVSWARRCVQETDISFVRFLHIQFIFFLAAKIVVNDSHYEGQSDQAKAVHNCQILTGKNYRRHCFRTGNVYPDKSDIDQNVNNKQPQTEFCFICNRFILTPTGRRSMSHRFSSLSKKSIIQLRIYLFINSISQVPSSPCTLR
eukprot:TRINITY_DN13045_c0_g1_i3.p2 TRINITY_DN13045_c0_g1~~TRINITY_DN13045_c0_g1_i3.p2  ORF type:complete len:168 (+),score=6.23 TRINITY_DN13045_c0_g1_i3:22-525(+)